MKLFNFIIVFLLMANAGHAASLVELQQMALGNRKVIAKYKANLEIRKEDLTIARSEFYPSFDVSYALNSLDEDNTLESKENSVAYGAITWNIFSGFKDKYNVRSASLLRKAEAHKLKGIKQDIQLNVALRYLSIFDRRANLQVAQDAHDTLLKVYKDAKNRFEVGLIDKNELLRFKVDLDNALITLKRAQAEQAKSLQLLQREIEAKVGFEELTFTEFDQKPLLKDYDSHESEMLTNRSEIKVLQETAEASEMQAKAEYATYYPSVDITSSYRKYDDDYTNGNGDNYDEELRAQLVMSLNLFDGFEKYSRTSRAKLETKTIQYDLEELKSDLKTELKNLFLDYEVSLDNAAVAKNNIKQAEENLRITRLKYKEGLETETDLLDSITNLSRAGYRYVAAKTNVFENHFRITRTVEGF